MRYDEHYLFDNHNTPILKAYFSALPKQRRDFRKHHHAECEISAFLSGTGTYTTAEKSYNFSPGSVFVFSGDEVHCITDITNDFTLLNLRFMPSLLVSEGGDLNLLKIFFSRSQSFENHIDPQNPATAAIHGKIKEIARELSENREGSGTMARYLLFSIFVSLIRDYNYVKSKSPYGDYISSVGSIGSALRYINENLERPLTLAEISSAAAMSSAYFSTVFKKINGLSPWRYITIKRVEKAVELLKTTDCTSLDIAMQCGFNSSSNFYKAFTAVTGKSPKDYRREK